MLNPSSSGCDPNPTKAGLKSGSAADFLRAISGVAARDGIGRASSITTFQVRRSRRAVL